jgi:hypothetical protein
VYDPAGVDITGKVVEYVIRRTVTEPPTVVIKLVGPVDKADMEITHIYLGGPVVCEITRAKSTNA